MEQIVIISFTCFLFGWFLPSPKRIIRWFKRAMYRCADLFTNFVARVNDDVELY